MVLSKKLMMSQVMLLLILIILWRDKHCILPEKLSRFVKLPKMKLRMGLQKVDAVVIVVALIQEEAVMMVIVAVMIPVVVALVADATKNATRYLIFFDLKKL